MKLLLSVLITVLIFTIAACSNNSGSNVNQAVSSSDTGKAVLAFAGYEHHFGKVEEGEKISYTFRYENKGTAPLAISQVTTTCGCTVPKYDTKPIGPGEAGNLEVVFDTSGRNGMQTKTISVRSNASVPVILLKITAEVHQK